MWKQGIPATCRKDKEELSKNETEEDLGDISITIPTGAPDNAAGKDTTSSSDKSSNTDSADSGSDSEKWE